MRTFLQSERPPPAPHTSRDGAPNRERPAGSLEPTGRVSKMPEKGGLQGEKQPAGDPNPIEIAKRNLSLNEGLE